MASNDPQKLTEIKRKLLTEFEMTDLGEPKGFLGIDIVRNRREKRIELSQVACIDKMLKRFGFSEM